MAFDDSTTPLTFDVRKFSYHPQIDAEIADYLNDAHSQGYYLLRIANLPDNGFLIFMRLTNEAIKAQDDYPSLRELLEELLENGPKQLQDITSVFPDVPPPTIRASLRRHFRRVERGVYGNVS